MSKVKSNQRTVLTVAATAIATAAVAALVMAGGVFAHGGHDKQRGPFGHQGHGLSVQDRLDILDLYARYSQDLDGGKADDFVTNVFAPNGTFHDPSLCDVGTAQLRNLAQTFGKFQQDHHEQHMPYNILIQGNGNQATGHSYVSIISQSLTTPNNPHVAIMGTYTDKFVKLHGQWLFLDREVWRPGTIVVDPRCPTDLSTLE
jgi:hypothetical protein